MGLFDAMLGCGVVREEEDEEEGREREQGKASKLVTGEAAAGTVTDKLECGA